MNADLKHKNLTDAIFCCSYTVSNILGYGFQEKVYENTLQHGKPPEAIEWPQSE